MTRVADLEERRDQALRDLTELDGQIRAGLLDEETAAELRARYEAEVAATLRELERRRARAGEPEPEDGPEHDPATSGPRPRGRVVLVSAAAVAAVAAAIVLVPGSTGVRPTGGFVTGNEAVETGRDLSEVTNEEMEAVVAENPDVVGMRLRLAHRYLDAGEDRKAVSHYLEVLDREDHPEAMSHLGWILFNDGRPGLATQLLTASLDRAPDEPETLWFLANVHLYGNDDPEAAVPLLERLLERDDLGERRAEVEATLTDARAQRSGR